MKTLYLTRHAQAEHNVASDHSIRDAVLTDLGRRQSAQLNEDTKNSFQQTAQLLVASPLRRTMQTLIGAYPGLKERLGSVTLLPQLQEVNDMPCDTGSDRSVLEADPEFASFDFSPLTPDWNTKRGIYDPANVKERAKWVRNWLRDREEQDIVVVAHGDLLRYITDGYNSSLEWGNAEVKLYTFASPDDLDARLTPLKEGLKEGGNDPTSSQK